MRRIGLLLIALLTSIALVMSAGCQKSHLKDTADEEEPDSGPEKPPIPQVK